MLQKLDSFFFMARYKMHTFLTDENGDVNIVSMVVLMGIAVLLAIVFRDQIKILITNLLKTITENATNVVNGD